MNRVEIGVGVERDRDGVTVNYLQSKIENVRWRASKEFGGVAIIICDGGWIDPNGEFVGEQGIIIRIDNVPAAKLDRARVFAEWVKKIFNQTAVAYSVTEVNTEFL